MSETMESIVAKLPAIREGVYNLREILLTNLVMLGEVPAPTFMEEDRVRLLQDRFIMSGLDSVSSDDAGNGLGLLPGADEEKGSILVVAHADTVIDEGADHTVQVQPHTVTGAGIGNNSLGLAVVASLPNFLETLDIKLNHSLVLMGTARSIGKGNLAGLQFFLDNSKVPVSCGLCVDALRLGRISHSSIGMLRGEVVVSVPKEHDWTREGIMGAIQVMGEIIARITEIPLPRKPRTFVVLGSVRGGNTYNVIATRAVLRFEIRSESAEMVDRIREQIEEITGEVASNTLADVEMNIVARRNPGGLEYSNPLPRAARQLLKSLEQEPHVRPSTSELAAFVDRQIPAITMGLTFGEEANEGRDILQIEPIFTGVTLLIGMLLAIDNGLCHAD